MKRTIAVLLLFFAAAAYADTPEMVVAIYRPKEGKDAELLQVLRDARATNERLSLVTGSHSLYRGSDDASRPLFVEIFTWKGHEIPDHAPPDVKKAWAAMRALVETRDGHGGIEFYEIEPVTAAAAPSK